MKTLLITSILLTAMPAVAAGKFSGELLLGESAQQFDASVGFTGSTPTETLSSPKKHSNSYGIRGSYQPFRFFALELEYQNYEKFTVGENFQHLMLDADALNLGVKGILPLSRGYSLSAGLGLAHWDVDSSLSSSFDSSDIGVNNDANRMDGQGNDPYYTLSANYQINEKIVVGLNYSVVTMKWALRNDTSNDHFYVNFEHEIKNIALSVGVRF